MDAAVIVAFVAGGSAFAVSVVGLVGANLSRPRRLQVEVEALQKLHGMLADDTAKQLYESIAANVLSRYGAKKMSSSGSGGKPGTTVEIGKYKLTAQWGSLFASIAGLVASVVALVLGVVFQGFMP